jgi:hypothetical protein
LVLILNATRKLNQAEEGDSSSSVNFYFERMVAAICGLKKSGRSRMEKMSG